MVKQGYKQTEVGVIPEDWDVRKIGDFTDATAGGTPSTSHPEYWNGEILWMSSGELNKRRIHNVIGRITELGYNNSSTHMIPENCVLIGLAGQGKTRGTVAVNYVELCTNQSIAAIFPSKEHNSEYLYQNLWSRYEELRELSSGDGGRGGLNLTIIKNFPCAFPKLQEQNRIAEALSDVDDMISSLEKLIAKKKAVKDGAMAMLLTARKRMAGFSKEWEFFQFKDTGIEIRKGQTITQKDVKFGNIPVVAGGKTPAYYCDKYNRDGKNITISASGASAGFVNMYSGKIFASDCSTISENEKYNIVFVYNMLKFLQSDIYASQTGGAQPHIHPNDIGELYLYYTFDIEEQNAIASILSDMDNEIEALEQKLVKTRLVKQGMMQQLLTGKIRLVSANADNKPIEAVSKPHHNHQFDDAVAIAAIVNEFYSDTIPLGRKKIQKLLYLLRRKQEADTSAFKKKAAGPYADEVRYKGGEPIAVRNKYVAKKQGAKGTTFSKGEKIESALEYIEKWEMSDDINWLVSTFKYTKTNDLELFATIDMAICDLINSGEVVSVASIKNLIASNKEWKDKLSKIYFSDNDIARAIRFCQSTFN